MTHMVVVVDQIPVYRSGVSHTLREHGLDVVELDVGQLLRAKVGADAFVVSANGPNSRELIREIRASHGDTPIVAVVPSSRDGPQHHAAVLTDGAIAAVTRDAPQIALASAV